MTNQVTHEEVYRRSIADLQGQLTNAYKRIAELTEEVQHLKRKYERTQVLDRCFHGDEEFCVVCNITTDGEELNV